MQPSGQSLWLYLLTGPHTTNVPGLAHVGEAALAEALRWPTKAFRKAFREVFREGMAEADWEARVVWIPNAIKYNPPESPNVVKGWAATWDEIPECRLKLTAYQHLKASVKAIGKPFGEAFEKAIGKPIANQEQEQEQEQERKDRPPNGGSSSPKGPTREQKDQLIAEWKGRYPGEEPAWARLKETWIQFAKAVKVYGFDEVLRRWRLCLQEKDPFFKGHSLKQFLSGNVFDRWATSKKDRPAGYSQAVADKMHRLTLEGRE